MSVVPVDSGTSKRNPKMASAQSVNHLLNFSLPPRQSQQHQSLPRRRKPVASAAVWSRERFVNAQYRFVMNPSGDYTVHFADPDIYFNWPDVLQIIVPRTSAFASAAGPSDHIKPDEGVTVCPICLSSPTAPRMTRCGHIFCFPCILHYLNTSDNTKWARCPICQDSVNEKSLKAVKWIDSPVAEEEDDNAAPAASSSSVTADTIMATPRSGSLLRMRLVQRPQITTLALPRSISWPSDLLPLHQAPFHFMPDVMTFSRFMLATPASLITDLIQDLDDLVTEKRILSGMHDELGIAFVDAAEHKVRHQIAKAAALETPQLKQAIDAAHNGLRRAQDQAAYRALKVQAAQQSAPLEDAPDAFLASQSSAYYPSRVPVEPPSVPAEPQARNPKQRRNVNPPVAPPSYYYYQAASGMPIFLSPLDIKILLNHFKSYADFPDTITVRVEVSNEGSVNNEVRKRFKYLAYLPDSADVVFVETDLEGVVGAESLKSFEKALTNRRIRRKDKERRDDKARARAEHQEKEKVVHTWNELTRHRPDAYIAPPSRASSPVPDFSDFPEPGQERAPPPPPPQQQEASGVWGARSFASAAQHPSRGAHIVPQQRQQGRRADHDQEDEWDLDLAFHALEQRAGNRGGGGRRKNNAKMVVLGGGGGRRR